MVDSKRHNGERKPNLTTDMTQGNSMIMIARFCFPLLLGNIFQQMYSVADTIIVGKGIGDKALAAVGACNSIQFFILGFIIGMTGGFGILLSQAFGAGDVLLLRRRTAMSALICLIVGIMVTLVSLLFIEKYFIYMETPANIIHNSLKYFRVILCGITITMGNNLCLNLLRALGDGKTPLKAMMVSSLINIILDLVFIVVLKTGAEGAAIATLIAQVSSVLFALRKIVKIPELMMERENWKVRPFMIRELLITGLPVAFMNSVTAIGNMVLQYFVNLMGSNYVAAYAACSKITGLGQQPGQAVGLTMLTFTGQNLGAGRYDRIKDGVKKGVLLSVLVNIPIIILLVGFPTKLASLMLTEPNIIAMSKEYLPITGICMVLLGFLFVFRSTCQGMGQTLMPMLSGGVEVVMRVSVVMLAVGLLGFYRIAVAEVSAWIGAWLMLMATYFYLIRRKKPYQNETNELRKGTV